LKLKIDKIAFLKSWSLAEHAANVSGSMNIFGTIHLTADENGVVLQATDIKTSIICTADGVKVIEPGEAVIPIKGVADLFKKSSASEFTLDVDEGKALMKSGKSRYRFSTYPVKDFPKLPSSSGASIFCSLKASALSSAIDKGTLCASPQDEFPAYLGAGYFEIKDGELYVVSTDKKRLAFCRTEINDFEETVDVTSLLLPFKALRGLQKYSEHLRVTPKYEYHTTTRRHISRLTV
jgi:DNA polymerase-3 subunit beta